MATPEEIKKQNELKMLNTTQGLPSQNVTTNPATLGSSSQQLGQLQSDNMGAGTAAALTAAPIVAGVGAAALSNKLGENAIRQKLNTIQPSKLNPNINIGSAVKGVGNLAKSALPYARAGVLPGVALQAGGTALDIYNTPTDVMREAYGLSNQEPTFLGDIGVRTRGALGSFFNPITGTQDKFDEIMKQRLLLQQKSQNPNVNQPETAVKASDVVTQQTQALFPQYNPANLTGLMTTNVQGFNPNIDYSKVDLTGNKEQVAANFANALTDPNLRTNISDVNAAIGSYMDQTKGNLSKSDAEKLALIQSVGSLRGGAENLLTEENLRGKSFVGGLIDIGRAKGLNKRATTLQDAALKMIQGDRVGAQEQLRSLQNQNISAEQQKAMQDARFTQALGASQASTLSDIEKMIAQNAQNVQMQQIRDQMEIARQDKESVDKANQRNVDLALKQFALNQPTEVSKQQEGLLNSAILEAARTGNTVLQEALLTQKQALNAKPQEQKQTRMMNAIGFGGEKVTVPQDTQEYRNWVNNRIDKLSLQSKNVADKNERQRLLDEINYWKAQ